MTSLHTAGGPAAPKPAPAGRNRLAKGKACHATDSPRATSGCPWAMHSWAADRGASRQPTGRGARIRRGEGT